MSPRVTSAIDVHDYHAELHAHRANLPADYHPATATEPRRALTHEGALLASSANGEGRSDWAYRPNVTVHMAVTGSGYAYGAAVAACNGGRELGQDADMADLVKAEGVDYRRRCRRPACRALWPQTSAPAPAQTPPSDGDQMT